MASSPIGTRQRVTVVIQGKVYVPSCNDCGWVSRVHRGNMKSAQLVNARHRETCPGLAIRRVA